MFPTLDETCTFLDYYDFFASDLKKIYPAYLYHHTISRLLLVTLMAVLHKIAQEAEAALMIDLTHVRGVEALNSQLMPN